ncbi:glycosyltransferase family 2 protein [Xylanimonas ulmi]|uniref:Glycosyl transferase family 2 n=1 Tax=Xylanimonas ulmi TaxID=228973 RepID=A0A4Q7LYX5_9MICO|nr:glycosyltransferase family 2 protein [Xylanibacterium ulmi]RZS59921.1 glycosyl transferase family 2 [Xylanibacterium ulmi]
MPRATAAEFRRADAWFVVPAFNEGPVIGGVVHEVRAAGFPVVVVDDASSDASGDLARAAGAVVVRHATNLGQGAALQTGIEFALRRGAAYVLTFDADGQHQVEDAVAMLSLAATNDLGFVFGSRFLDDRTDTGTLKRLVLRFAAWFTRHSTGMRLTDAHNGLRVIRADVAAQVDLHQNRMAHATEIVRQLGRTRAPWAEYPVHVLYTDYSRGKGQSLWNSVNILVDLMFR